MTENAEIILLRGRRCVWDTDLLSPDAIKAYHADDPQNSLIFRRGEIADAMPGWSMVVDDLFFRRGVTKRTVEK